MRHKRQTLLRHYQAALRRYLKEASTANLKTALKLGRQVMDMGLETLDLALIHEQALIAQVLPINSSKLRDRIVKRARTFFAEAIVPLEETHRSAMETNVHLSKLNKALSQRTLDLATSNRKLQIEIATRKVMVQNLRQSEQHSGRLLNQSRHLQEQLRFLSRRILSTQEEERKRISRELHDVIAQALTSINIRLAILKTEATVGSKNLAKSIEHTQKMVEKSVNIVHKFAYDLRPAVLDYLGLIPALHSFMKNFTKKTGIRVSLTAFTGVDKMDGAKRTVLYRVVQESLANAARHAQARKVEVNIRRLPNAVCMDISDNGKGFEPKRVLFAGKCKRLGLLGIRERVEMVGGKFAVESAPGKGTTIHVQIPFDNGCFRLKSRKDTRP